MNELKSNKLGIIKIKLKMKDENHNITKQELEISKLSQEELADDWMQVLPRKKSQQIHHFNISLAELPQHLWNNINVRSSQYIDENNINLYTDNYYIVTDKIFIYSINRTIHDKYIYELYKELNNKYTNKNKIYDLYKYCIINRLYGWIILKAEKYLSN